MSSSLKVPKKKKKSAQAPRKAEKSFHPPISSKKKPTKPLTSSEFAALQKYWHKKAADSGFKDLERFADDGKAFTLMPTFSLYNLGMSYNTERETFYRRLQNFITHNPKWHKQEVRLRVAELYIEGVSMRKVVAALRSRGYKISLWGVFTTIRLLVQLAVPWNRSHCEGLDFVADVSGICRVHKK